MLTSSATKRMLSVMKTKVSFFGCWANTLATSSKEDTILQNGRGLVTRINEGSSYADYQY